MEIIRKYAPGTEEYERLEKAAEILTLISPNRKRYYVGDTYFDFGQDWMWTTILREDKDWGDSQALTPRDYEKILTGNILTALNDIVTDKWWTDK